MCGPLLPLTAAVGAAQAFAEFFAQQAQYKAQQAAFDQTAALAEASADLELRGLRTRQVQEREAASQEISAIATEVTQRRGLARLSAVESGVGGGVLRLVDRDFTSQGANRTFGVTRQLGFIEGQIELEAKAVRMRQHSRVLAALPTTPAPSLLTPFLGTALSIGEAQSAAPEGTFLGL